MTLPAKRAVLELWMAMLLLQAKVLPLEVQSLPEVQLQVGEQLREEVRLPLEVQSLREVQLQVEEVSSLEAVFLPQILFEQR
jgi:citrate lyase gamma subunit